MYNNISCTDGSTMEQLPVANMPLICLEYSEWAKRMQAHVALL